MGLKVQHYRFLLAASAAPPKLTPLRCSVQPQLDAALSCDDGQVSSAGGECILFSIVKFRHVMPWEAAPSNFAIDSKIRGTCRERRLIETSSAFVNSKFVDSREVTFGAFTLNKNGAESGVLTSRIFINRQSIISLLWWKFIIDSKYTHCRRKILGHRHMTTRHQVVAALSSGVVFGLVVQQ